MKSLQKLLIPGDFLGLIRTIVSTMAMLTIIKYAVGHSFAKAIEVIVESYKNVVDTLFKPIEPLAVYVSEVISKSLPFELHPDFYWKYIFIVTGVYFFGRVRVAFKAGRWGTAIFRSAWGTIVGFLSSIIVTSIPLASGDMLGAVVIAALCVLAILIYELDTRNNPMIWGSALRCSGFHAI